MYTKYFNQLEKICTLNLLHEYSNFSRNFIKKSFIEIPDAQFIFLSSLRQTDPVIERMYILKTFLIISVPFFDPFGYSHDLRQYISIPRQNILIHYQQWRHQSQYSSFASSFIFFRMSRPNRHIFFSSWQTTMVRRFSNY